MDIRYMRSFVSDAYNGEKWKRKVNRMNDNQIIAIYHSLIRRNSKQQKESEVGYYEKLPTVAEILEKQQPKETYHQVTMFEYLSGLKKEE